MLGATDRKPLCERKNAQVMCHSGTLGSNLCSSLELSANGFVVRVEHGIRRSDIVFRLGFPRPDIRVTHLMERDEV